MTLNELQTCLDHGAVDRNVSADAIEQQLRTAVALRSGCSSLGGAILGDEVGTGKTFVAFALLAMALLEDDSRGSVILVPTGLLEAKWEQQLQSYLRTAVRDRRLGEVLAGRVVRLDRSLRVVGSGKPPRRNAIVIGQHSLFSYGTSRTDKAITIEAYLSVRRDLARRPLLRFLAACGLAIKDLQPAQAGWADFEQLRRSPKLMRPLDEPFELWRSGQRDVTGSFAGAIQQVRRNVGKKLLPSSALVIVDEAHNLRSTRSQIYQSLMHTLSDKFDALLFLTGTPFQLGRNELSNIVSFFSKARGHESRQLQFEHAVQRMNASMDGYVSALDNFGNAWRGLDEGLAARVVELVRGEPPTHDDGKVAADAAETFRKCLGARQRLEAGLRPFLVRSVRHRHHNERPGLFDPSLLYAESRIPLALVDRMLYELFRERGKTFVASALQGACSSWSALFESAVMDDERPQAQATRRQLRSLKKVDALGPHPKVESTLAFCREGLDDGEKTLVFVERVHTGHMIQSELAKRLADLDPDDDAKDVLQKRTRFGWPSLRENYLHTVYPLAFGSKPDPAIAAELAHRHEDLFARVDTGRGTYRDYAVEKRFWEHVYFLDSVKKRRVIKDIGYLRETVDRLTNCDYVLNGLDLVSGEGEKRTEPTGKRGFEARGPRLEFAAAYLQYPSPWQPHAVKLAELLPGWRATLVDQAASSIGRSHLRHEVAALSTDRDARKHFDQVHGLLANPDRGWPARFKALVEQMVEAGKDPESLETGHRVRRLLGALSSNERVQFIGPESKPDTRERAVAGFNTPLYPDVLIATPVLAEGIDLHRSCRRIVHHDLPWNPAKLEQRTGRIDRVGSLAERLRENDPEACIEASLPYMDGTYDQFIYNRVMARRREFRCLLGSPPQWEQEELAEDERGQPIAEEIVRQLQVNLGPSAIRTAG